MRLFRTPGEKPGVLAHHEPQEEDTEELEPEEARNILCVQCQQKITNPEERITVEGAHRHTFANPSGIVYEIGCFQSAVGCGYAGEPTGEFTWFKGYQWRIAICRTCLTHLGWLFTSETGNSFAGLILDRLVFPD